MPRYPYIIEIAAVVVLVFGLGCTEDKPPLPATDAQSNTLRIVFTWPGDDLASRQELEIRNRIAQRIVREGVGKIIRSGTGMGWMDLVVEVEDTGIARREIEPIVRNLSPDSGFTIQVGEN
jgi:hypothetical protein